MNTLYYRKIAQIAHRDGDGEIKLLAARYLPIRPGERGPTTFKKSDRRRLKAWFKTWLEKPLG